MSERMKTNTCFYNSLREYRGKAWKERRRDEGEERYEESLTSY